MQNSWVKPSLSRDFAFLSVAVIFVLMLVSGWVTYNTYEKHIEHVKHELEQEAARIERAVSTEMSNVDYMLASLGRQIAIDPNRDLTKLAQSLKSFDSKGNLYSIFTWTNNDHQMVVSSNRGVLDSPVDISDRDFIQEASKDSWKIHIGQPKLGRVSEQWIIPVGMGVTDYTGKFIGIISLSMNINKLTEHISNMIKREGLSFAIVSKDFIPIAESSDDKKFSSDTIAKKLVDYDLSKNTSGFISEGSFIFGTANYVYYRVLGDYPYIAIVGYDSEYMDENVRVLLWSRLFQVLLVAWFFIIFFWVVRSRVVNPVLEMTKTVSEIASGKNVAISYDVGPIEISSLATQIQKVASYIEEIKKIESELRYKMFQMKREKENSEIALRSKSEFLIYIAQEIRKPLSNMIGFSQIIKDQMYGTIEEKYKAYADDIFKTGNSLIAKMQDLLLYSKVETGYMPLKEKSVDISFVVSAALRQLSDILQEKSTSVKVRITEPAPRIFADEFRLQQIINNLLLITLDSSGGEKEICIEAKTIGEHRESQFFVILISLSGKVNFESSELLSFADSIIVRDAYNLAGNYVMSEQIDIRLGLAKMLALLHEGYIRAETVGGRNVGFVIFLPASRLVADEGE